MFIHYCSFFWRFLASVNSMSGGFCDFLKIEQIDERNTVSTAGSLKQRQWNDIIDRVSLKFVPSSN